VEPKYILWNYLHHGIYKMKWLDRWVTKRYKEMQCEKEDKMSAGQAQNTKPLGSLSVNKSTFSSDGMNFTVYKAVGGYVIEFRHYDMQTDSRHAQLHIVSEAEDIGAEIGKILTLESLRGSK